MTFLRAAVRGGEERGRVIGDGSDPLVLGARTNGMLGNSDRAVLGVTPFYAGVSMIVEDAASVPLQVRQRVGDEVTVDETSRLAQVFANPNEEQSSGDLVEWGVASLLLRGRAYFWRRRTPDGRFNGYIPLNPARVQPFRHKGRMYYLVAQDVDSQDQIAGTQDDILYIRGWGFGGLAGHTPVEQLRNLLRAADGEQRHQQSMLDRGVRPGGILRVKDKLSDEAGKKLAEQWRSAFAGANNAGRTPVLEEGAEWQSITLSAADAQFLEQRQFTRQEVAVVLRLPAQRLLASSGSNLHYDSAAMDLQYYAQLTLKPRLDRIRRAFARDREIPWVDEQSGVQRFPWFDLDAMADADPSSRYANYRAADWWLTPNDIRRREGLKPVEGGDVLRPASKAAPPTERSTP